MANDFTSNPWSIDTAYSTIPSPGHIAGSMVKAISITWSDQAAGGAAQVIIKDVNGKTIVDAISLQANTPVVVASPSWVHGILVPTLSGKLSIAIHKG